MHWRVDGPGDEHPLLVGQKAYQVRGLGCKWRVAQAGVFRESGGPGCACVRSAVRHDESKLCLAWCPALTSFCFRRVYCCCWSRLWSCRLLESPFERNLSRGAS